MGGTWSRAVGRTRRSTPARSEGGERTQREASRPTRAQEAADETFPTAVGWLEQLQKLVPAVEGKVVPTTGKMVRDGRTRV